jgi:hypothetical protein
MVWCADASATRPGTSGEPDADADIISIRQALAWSHYPVRVAC